MSSSVMELELGLGLPNSTAMEPFDNMNILNTNCSKKRRLGKPFEKKTAALPLFEDEAQSECDNGDGNREVTSQFYNFKAKELVGWPPVKLSWTKGGTNKLSGESAIYVKVTMEGVFIGRKIDLSVHNSYKDLFTTLDRMFPFKNRDDNMTSTNHHEVAYEDGDGDWMLVGDVPWEDFVKSVRRIKIMG
ncbi:hypothetical protein LUZ60_000851 [Juncus effusus]|nr:hypothetical protein LUZ60_000851 [Juncus effusus]